jgi:predicted GNAT family N-acyltransferase
MTAVIAQTTDIATCQRLRHQVFVVEQGVATELEVDGLDGQAVHLLATVAGRPVGTARLLAYADKGKIGRVCVVADQRGTGLGAALMQAGVAHFRAQPGVKLVTLGAQVTALGFYERLGFVAQGPVFDDAGIDHREMILRL